MFIFRAAVLSVLLASTPVVRSQSVSIVNTPTLLPPSQQDVELYVMIDGNIEGPKGTSIESVRMKMDDLTKSSGATLSPIGTPCHVGGQGKRHFWRTVWHVEGLQSGGQDTHAFLVQIGSFSDVVRATIQRPGDSQVTLTGPGAAIRLRFSRDAQIQIASSYSLSDVAIASSTVLEESTGQPLPSNVLELSTDPNGSTNGGRINTKPPVTFAHMRISRDFSAAGKFTGQVILGTQQRPSLGAFTIAVYSTSCRHRLWGLLCLFLGVMTYFGVAVAAKGRTRWIVAVLPAIRLREEAQRLIVETEAVRGQTGYGFTTLLAAPGNPGSLRDIVDRLDLKKLKSLGYLPLSFANPFTGQEIPANYQALLLSTSNQISTFQLMVRWGLASISAMWSEVVTWKVQADGLSALQKLDQLSLSTGPPDFAKAQIQPIIAGLQNAITQAQLAAKALGGGAKPDAIYRVPGSQSLTIQLEGLSAAVWIIWGILTLLVGACALILFNDGFGTPQDYMRCFLWGVGMPAVGQGFGGLTLNSVSSAFSLQTGR